MAPKYHIIPDENENPLFDRFFKDVLSADVPKLFLISTSQRDQVIPSSWHSLVKINNFNTCKGLKTIFVRAKLSHFNCSFFELGLLGNYIQLKTAFETAHIELVV